MRSDKRTLFSRTLLSAAGLTLGACARGLPPPAAEQVLRMALNDEPPTLDPALTTSTAASHIIRQLFAGLVRFDRDLNVVPWAAHKWDVSADGKTYTFHINKDIRWHDGQGAVTAADFKYSIERAIKRKDSTVAMLYLGDIVGAKDLLDGNIPSLGSVIVRDPYTLEITIDASKAYFLGKLVYPTSYAVKADAVERGGATWSARPETLIGAGPFRLLERVLDQRLVLGRFDGYWEGPAALTRVELPIVKDENTRLAMYEKGDLDLVTVPAGQLDRARTDPQLGKELLSSASLSIIYLAMNQAKTPFDNTDVRRAFNHAVNKAQLADVALKGLLAPADGIVPPGMPGHNRDLRPLGHNAARAKELLARAGYPGGRGLPPVTIVTRQGNGTLKRVAEVLTGMLQQSLGLEVKIEEMEWGAFLAQVQRGDAPACFVLGWAADYPDPQNFLDILFHSTSRNNRTSYHNPRVDRLLDQAATERDTARRMRLYNEAEQVIVDDAAWVPLTYGKQNVLQRGYVRGATHTPQGLLHYYPIQMAAR